MKIDILTKNLELNSELEKYINERMGGIERLLVKSDNVSANLRIGKDVAEQKHGEIFFAEITISTDHKNYGAGSRGESINEAIDNLKDEVSKKIRRHKDKRISLKKKGGRIIKDLLRKFKK